MQEQLISFETAKLAKCKGFNEYCISWFEEDKIIHFVSDLEDYPSDQLRYGSLKEQYSDLIILRPTQSLLQRWLREVHKIIVEPCVFNIGAIETNKFCFQYRIYNNTEDWETVFIEYKTYEIALEAGLQEALKLIK